MERKTDDHWEIIDKQLQNNHENYKHCLIRLALKKLEQNIHLYFCRVDFCNEQQKPKDLQYVYDDFTLISHATSIEEAKTLLSNVRREGIMHIADLEIDLKSNVPKSHHFLASGEAYGLVDVDWPTYYLTSEYSGHSVSSERLNLKAIVPPYPSKLQAIIDFMDLRPSLSDVNSQLFVLLPDFRARIKALNIMGNILEVEVDSNSFDDSDLTVKFYCRRGVEKRQPSSDIQVRNGVASFIAGFEPDSVEATLVGLKDNEVLDRKSFHSWHTNQKGIVFKTPKSHILDVITKGENNTVEFKSSHHDKNDFLETVMSFANTKGGMLILGVDDKKNIRGISDRREDVEKSVQGMIIGNCEPNIEVGLEWVEIKDSSIFIIRIPEGTDKPYILRDKGIYVREGKDDYQIDRKQLDSIYQKKSPGGDV